MKLCFKILILCLGTSSLLMANSKEFKEAVQLIKDETTAYKRVLSDLIKLVIKNSSIIQEKSSASGDTLLHFAYRRHMGKDQFIKYLLRKGADENAKNKNNQTAAESAEFESIQRRELAKQKKEEKYQRDDWSWITFLDEPKNVFDAYVIFDLQQGASWDDVVKKYRSLIKLVHPDLNAKRIDAANKNTYKVNQAYDILKRHYRK